MSSLFTLWLVGLGIEHIVSRSRHPTDQPHVERSHRTLKERTLENQEFESAEALQKQVDADWQELNAACPSRAPGCGGRRGRARFPRKATCASCTTARLVSMTALSLPGLTIYFSFVKILK